VLCTPIGGETGLALRALLGDLPADGLVACPTPNGSYVHDRRGGEREEIALLRSGVLDRHVVDDLVSITLGVGMGSTVAAVCGSNLDRNIDVDVFERVCRDLAGAGTTVVADLSDDELRAALKGGIALLKISSDELVDGGWAVSADADAVVAGVQALRAEGARDVVVSCALDGSIAAFGDTFWRAAAPEMSVVEPRGAGDSMTAALVAGVKRGLDPEALMRTATAAAALNVTRHGLASGHPSAIDKLSELVTVEVLDV
jgi:1-phosphofructokinase